MFEKAAEEYALDNYENCTYDNFPYASDFRAREQSFKDGAVIGYNKCKEEAEDIINELLVNGYDESIRAKALNFLYPVKE